MICISCFLHCIWRPIVKYVMLKQVKRVIVNAFLTFMTFSCSCMQDQGWDYTGKTWSLFRVVQNCISLSFASKKVECSRDYLGAGCIISFLSSWLFVVRWNSEVLVMLCYSLQPAEPVMWCLSGEQVAWLWLWLVQCLGYMLIRIWS